MSTEQEVSNASIEGAYIAKRQRARLTWLHAYNMDHQELGGYTVQDKGSWARSWTSTMAPQSNPTQPNKPQPGLHQSPRSASLAALHAITSPSRLSFLPRNLRNPTPTYTGITIPNPTRIPRPGCGPIRRPRDTCTRIIRMPHVYHPLLDHTPD